MTRSEYIASICARRDQAVQVPFVEVSPDGWTPEIAGCHPNVDRWVKENPGCEAVRGWITYMVFGPAGVQLTAHSVVRDERGSLFDITPVKEGQPRGGAFVEHQGDPALFCKMKDHDIRCPSLDPAADAEALREVIGEADFGADNEAEE